MDKRRFLSFNFTVNGTSMLCGAVFSYGGWVRIFGTGVSVQRSNRAFSDRYRLRKRTVYLVGMALSLLLPESMLQDRAMRLSDELEYAHRETWQDREDGYWLSRLAMEVDELHRALVGKHRHSPETELAQIAAMARNWLRKGIDRD